MHRQRTVPVGPWPAGARTHRHRDGAPWDCRIVSRPLGPAPQGLGHHRDRTDFLRLRPVGNAAPYWSPGLKGIRQSPFRRSTSEALGPKTKELPGRPEEHPEKDPVQPSRTPVVFKHLLRQREGDT